MSQKPYTSAHIDRYLQGKMSLEEERDFLLSLKQNTRLRHLALIKVLFIKHIRASYSRVTNIDRDKHTHTDM